MLHIFAFVQFSPPKAQLSQDKHGNTGCILFPFIWLCLYSWPCSVDYPISYKIRIYLLAHRNLLWDILRFPSSRRAVLGLFILTLWRVRARTSHHTHCAMGDDMTYMNCSLSYPPLNQGQPLWTKMAPILQFQWTKRTANITMQCRAHSA